MQKMRRVIIAFVIGIGIPLLATPTPSIAAQLITVTGIKLEDHDSLWGITIKIAHARVVAVCRAFVG